MVVFTGVMFLACLTVNKWVLPFKGQPETINQLTGRSRFNSCFDACIGTTAANIAKHGSFYFGITGFWICFQQGGCIHDLTALTITALSYVMLKPGLLQGVVTVFRQPLNGGNGLIAYLRYGQLTGTHSNISNKNGAASAKGNTTAVFGTHQAEMIAKHPEYWSGRVYIHLLFFSVNVQVESCHDFGILNSIQRNYVLIQISKPVLKVLVLYSFRQPLPGFKILFNSVCGTKLAPGFCPGIIISRKLSIFYF
jgi:hypothetical protein